jgi:hypothetical protein
MSAGFWQIWDTANLHRLIRPGSLGAQAVYSLHSLGPVSVESHICQNRADMGHPRIHYTEKALTEKLLVRKCRRAASTSFTKKDEAQV